MDLERVGMVLDWSERAWNGLRAWNRLGTRLEDTLGTSLDRSEHIGTTGRGRRWNKLGTCWEQLDGTGLEQGWKQLGRGLEQPPNMHKISYKKKLLA